MLFTSFKIHKHSFYWFNLTSYSIWSIFHSIFHVHKNYFYMQRQQQHYRKVSLPFVSTVKTDYHEDHKIRNSSNRIIYLKDILIRIFLCFFFALFHFNFVFGFFFFGDLFLWHFYSFLLNFFCLHQCMSVHIMCQGEPVNKNEKNKKNCL